VVRASCPLITKDGQDAHPTKWDNLFSGVPLAKRSHSKNKAASHPNLIFKPIAQDLLYSSVAVTYKVPDADLVIAVVSQKKSQLLRQKILRD
jgi:hypothetical protein